MFASKPSKVPFVISALCIPIYAACVVMNLVQRDWLIAAIWAAGATIWFYVARTQLRTYRIEQETYRQALEFEAKYPSLYSRGPPLTHPRSPHTAVVPRSPNWTTARAQGGPTHPGRGRVGSPPKPHRTQTSRPQIRQGTATGQTERRLREHHRQR